MDRLRSRRELPKAKSFHETGSLECMVRDTLYLAWPMASFSQDERPRRRLTRRQEAIEEEDDDIESYMKERLPKMSEQTHIRRHRQQTKTREDNHNMEKKKDTTV